MRALAYVLVLVLGFLLLLVVGCAPEGFYFVEHPAQTYSAYAVGPSRLVTIVHPVERVFVVTQRGRQPGKVVERYGDVLVVEPEEGHDLDLHWVRPGDSGSGVIDSDGNLVGVIRGRKLKE
jgi:hypothetical protein